MIVKSLINTPFSDIISCFYKAFNNYFVEIPNNDLFWKERWKQAGVDYDLSFGMFEDEKLIGFIIHAVDWRNEILVAYNSGTGVIPEYRGQRIIQTLYKYAIPKMKETGIKRCTLEVIVENEKAIKSYKSLGFVITRKYKCYRGELSTINNSQPKVIQIQKDKVDWTNYKNQNSYSWDFHKNVVDLVSSYQYYHVMYKDEIESSFIINPINGSLAQFDVLVHNDQSMHRLFEGIGNISKTIRINNVDEKFESKIEYLNEVGVNNTIDQFEMELQLL